MREVPMSETIKKIEKGVSLKHMGRLRFELRTNRLKAECSTAELATRLYEHANQAPLEVIT